MKSKEMFLFLRGLVRSGSLDPAYARQVFKKHLESLGGEIPAGMAAWFQHGWHYDHVVWGTRTPVSPSRTFRRRRLQNLQKPVFAAGKLPHLPN